MFGRQPPTDGRAWFCASYAVFIVAQYLVRAPAVISGLFYLVVSPCLLAYLRREPATWECLRSNRLWRWYSALLVYVGVQSVFFPVHWGDIPSSVSSVASTALFFCASGLFFAVLSEQQRLRFWLWLAVLGAVSAAVSVGLHVAHYSLVDRLEGIGRASNPNHTGYVYAIAALATLLCLERAAGRWFQWGAAALALLALTTAILLTQSRTAIALHAACLCTLGTYILHRRLSRRLSYGLAAVASILAACLLASGGVSRGVLDYLDILWLRGDSYRLELWQAAWDLFVQRPWIGYGLDAPIGNAITESPHNIYLSTFFYFGLPAGCALLVAVGLTVYSAFRRVVNEKSAVSLFNVLLLGIGLVSGIVDHRQIVRGPCPMWTIFWLPIAVAVGDDMARRRSLISAKG